MVQAHQPGEAVFRSILPEEIDWKPFPAFPLAARLAVRGNSGTYLCVLHTFRALLLVLVRPLTMRSRND
jgi:hypothetical protein